MDSWILYIYLLGVQLHTNTIFPAINQSWQEK